MRIVGGIALEKSSTKKKNKSTKEKIRVNSNLIYGFNRDTIEIFLDSADIKRINPDNGYPDKIKSFIIDKNVNNGKLRTTILVDKSLDKVQLEEIAINNEITKKWLGDSLPKKVIVVPGRLVNIVY